MSIAQLKLDQKSKLAFAVSITGASGIPESRFIIEGKDFNISYPCKQTNEGVEVEIDGLRNVLGAGEYKARLEVVLENKIYTPLRDTITFEPIVEVLGHSKPVMKIEETVTVDTITVNPQIDENILRKTQAATIIAKSLNYIPEQNETPQQIITHAIENTESMSTSQLATLKDMLELAESVGIDLGVSITK